MNSIELREILQDPNYNRVIKKFLAKGFVAATQNKEYQDVSLVDIAHGNRVAEIEVEHGKHCYVAYLILSVKGYEDCTFVWLEQTQRHGDGYIPYRGEIFVKKNEEA